MGGRGSKSGAKGGGISKASEARSFYELKSYMESQGVKFGDGLEDKDLELLKSVSEEMLYFKNEFPQAANSIRAIEGKDSITALAEANITTQYTGGGTIYLSQKFNNMQTLKSAYQHSVETGFSPSGTTYINLASHEIGHLLEGAMMDKAYSGNMVERTKALSSKSEAKRILSNASVAAKKTADGKGKSNIELKLQISKYAAKNPSEALAEAVSDYRANGANAKPLSRAIWAELKKELG